MVRHVDLSLDRHHSSLFSLCARLPNATHIGLVCFAMDTSKESGEPEVAQRDLIAGIEEVTNKDHDLTVIQAFKVYLKAIAWSAVLSAALIMDGYDFKLFGLLVAQPAFNEKYGNPQPDGTYQISAAWQSGLTNGSNIGQMVGRLPERQVGLPQEHDDYTTGHSLYYFSPVLCTEPGCSRGRPSSAR